MLRNFTLSLEPHNYAIFYHWNYFPSVKNIRGSLGRIYGDGSLFGLSFDELTSLGRGTHNIRMDEHNRTSEGTKPEFNNERNQFELFRLMLFGYEHGFFTQTEVLMQALLSFTPEHSESVFHIAPVFLQDSLIEYAARPPRLLAERTPDSFDFFSSTGSTRIPDKNLVLLHEKLFSESAG